MPRYLNRFAVGLLILLGFLVPAVSSAATTLTSSWAKYGQGSFWVLNNVWGAGSLVNGVDYTQSITFATSTFPNGTVISWNWPSATSVLSYPEIVYGTQDGTPVPAGVTMPPSTQVANFTNLSTQYSFSTSGQTYNFDVGFDLWLTSQPNGAQSTNQDELMVFVHDPWGHVSTATNFGTLNNSGIYVSYNWGNGVQNWTFIASVPTADQLTGMISFSDILKTLIWDGVITGNEYISGIELGAEVGGGTGSLTVNNLSYQWIAKPTITGTAGNDTFTIAAVGGNHIVGNGGVDTVVYAGSYSNYQLKSSTSSEILVTAGNNISTLDVLQGITSIKFSDGNYDVTQAKFTPTASTPDTTPPSAPTNLTGSVASSSQINLTWSASTDDVGVTGYKVFRDGTQVGTPTATSYSDTGLAASTAYSYTVAAYDAAGNTSAQSSSLSLTTPAPTPTPTPTVTPTPTKFIIGDRVQTTETVNVRSAPSITAKKAGASQKAGKIGTVTDGPATGSGYTWWKVNFDRGSDGWVVEDYLGKASIAASTLSQTISQLQDEINSILAQINLLNIKLEAAVEAAGQ